MNTYDLLLRVGVWSLLGSLLLALLVVVLRLMALPLALAALVLDGLAELATKHLTLTETTGRHPA